MDLLDTVRRGRWQDAMDLLSSDATMDVPQFKLSVRGRDLRVFLQDSLFFFPDLTYRPHTRSVGHGVVIDEGSVHGNPPSTITGGRPMACPIMVAVEHTETGVRRILVDLDPSPIQEALGRKVNRSAPIFSEVQELKERLQGELETLTLSPDGPAADRRPDEPVQEQPRRGLGGIIRRR